MDNVSTAKLMKDMRAVVIDAEDLLKATASQTGERIDKVRAKAEDSIRNARERLHVAGDNVVSSAREAADDVNEQVKLHPWMTAGIAAGIGVLLGIVIGRR